MDQIIFEISAWICQVLAVSNLRVVSIGVDFEEQGLVTS